MCVCLSVCPLAYLKDHIYKRHEIFCMLFGAMAQTSNDDSGVHLCTSGCVNDVMFSHNGLSGVWRWQYLRERRAGVNSHKFSMYSSGGGTLFDFVVIYNGSKLRASSEI